jgi:hypothetical protein
LQRQAPVHEAAVHGKRLMIVGSNEVDTPQTGLGVQMPNASRVRTRGAGPPLSAAAPQDAVERNAVFAVDSVVVRAQFEV